MPVSIDLTGHSIASYLVTAKLGEGGMGQVWRATDTRLEREVAIKLLPAELIENVDSLARFEREAKLLAQLQHPNIASIYGLEEAAGMRALVMELVPGPTLAERLEQGALPLDEALVIARQIAEALEEAHEKGIVHRDLKPQNVKAPLESASAHAVKVLDFGLAKAMEPTAGDAARGASKLAASPTLTLGATVQGVILGTAAYMAPEQAKGLPVDRRADIWAFGVVLWEMLTGRRMFDGDSVPEVLAGVLKSDLDLDALPPGTPPAIRRLLRRCVERNPKNRLHDIADARLVLDEVLSGRADEVSPVAREQDAPAAITSIAGRGRLGWAVAALLAALLAGVAIWPAISGRSPAPRPPFYRFTISSASGASIASAAGYSAISPDGRRVVFVGADVRGRQGLWIQELEEVRARLLPGTEGASYPFWAPDSRRVGFFADAELRVASIGGEPIATLCSAPEGRGAAWGRGGTIVFAPEVSGPLFAVGEGGGTPRQVTRPEEAETALSHRNPSFLPDGKRFVYIADPGANTSEGRVYLGSLEGGESRLLYGSRRAPVYAAPGYLIDAIEDRLVARPFDPAAGELVGEPRRLAEAIPGYAHTQDRVASVSESGALLVAAQEPSARKLVWVDRGGRRLSEVLLPDQLFGNPRLSPDGSRLAIVTYAGVGQVGDVWMVELESGLASRLTFGAGSDEMPVWSADGASLLFQSDRSGVNDVWIRDFRSGEERSFYSSRAAWKAPGSWVGDLLAFEVAEKTTGFDISLLRTDRPDEAPVRLLASTASEREPAISPDGGWLAYTSNESGRDQIYVVSLPDARLKYQVTTDGGGHAIWTRGGRELVYATPSLVVASVPVTGSESLAFGKPEMLFSIAWASLRAAVARVFDVVADGSRFVFLEPEAQDGQVLVVVTDWLAELEGNAEE